MMLAASALARMAAAERKLSGKRKAQLSAGLEAVLGRFEDIIRQEE